MKNPLDDMKSDDKAFLGCGFLLFLLLCVTTISDAVVQIVRMMYGLT